VEADRCPDCGSTVVEFGTLTKDGLSLFPLQFTPSWRWFAFFRWNKGVDVPCRSNACPSCGLVWSRLDPGRLRTFIERYGTSEAKVELARVSKPQAEDDLD